MILKTKRLCVTVEQPHIFPNTTTRFDHTGFISSVVLDGRYEFCTSEPTNLIHPTSGGVGICNEYMFAQTCEEAAVGERFAKFGIGLFLKKDDRPYCFFREYDTEFFPVTWTQEDAERITFHTKPLPCNGYAVSQTKEIFVSDNTITMNITLKNEGEKPVDMVEFCHNFLTIDKKPLGPEYFLDIPALHDRGSEIQTGTVCGNGRGYSFTFYNPKAALVKVFEDELDIVDRFEWTLRNVDSPAAVHGEVDFNPVEIDVWSIDHMISMQTYKKISLSRGEAVSWQRKWTFTDENDA